MKDCKRDWENMTASTSTEHTEGMSAGYFSSEVFFNLFIASYSLLNMYNLDSDLSDAAVKINVMKITACGRKYQPKPKVKTNKILHIYWCRHNFTFI